MAAAMAREAHDMILASAETRPGRTGDVSRRRVCRVPEERDQSKGNGEVAERARRREQRGGLVRRRSGGGWVLRGILGSVGRAEAFEKIVNGERGT